ncbi:MAG: PolC-type DNA polymerase III [Bacilli bacterium]|nr:PolC-type DNA polymerase III [Bacilli bacterium]
MKDEKLIRFFNTINFDEQFYSCFENASVKEVLLNKKINRMTLIIDIDNLPPIGVFCELCEKAQDLKGADSVRLKFNVLNNNKLFEDYFNYYFDILIDRCPSLECVDRSKISFEDNKITFYVLNSAEEEKIISLSEKIDTFLSDMGFDDIEVNAVIDEEAREKFKKELLTTSEVVENKETKKVIKGKSIVGGEVSQIKNLISNENNVIIVGHVFGVDSKSTQSGWYIVTIKITDYTDSIMANIFTKEVDEYNFLLSNVKAGKWYKFKGNVKFNTRSNDYEYGINDIETYDKTEIKLVDEAEVKRVELHAHTMMSQMDGLTKLDLGAHTCELVSRCMDMGYRGVAITDHNGCQAFPIAYGIISSYNKKIEDPTKKFIGIYGTELTLVDDMVNISYRPSDDSLEDSTFVVFDTETTGFNAANGDSMIEIGAVKLKDGVIIDRFDELINPGRSIPSKITELTDISDEMVKDCDNEENVTKRFLEWAGDNPMVAHNAKFDIGFIEMAMKKYNLGEFKNTVIDTLELSRTLDQGFARHSLSALVKRYNVPFDEDSHHRADYDAEGTALVFSKMIKKLVGQNYETIADLDKLISKDEIHKFGRTYHFNALALNREGLKNLFKIISLANTTYFHKTPRILRSKLNELRDGLLIGSGCYESEVFIEARSKDGEELTNIINFYDYVEVQPPEVYDHLIQLGDFSSEIELKTHIRKIIDAVKGAGKIIVATGDVHHFTRDDKIYREIIVNQKVPGGGRHPLAKNDITSIPSQHFRTTNEMLNDFNFLDEDLAYEIVVTNTNKIADMVGEFEVIIDTGGVPFSPRVRSDDGKEYLDCPRVVTDLVYKKAMDWYGDPLPHNIEERISKELYGDIVFNYWNSKLKDENPDISESELEKLTFERLHETILKGFDHVKELVTEYVLSNWKEEDGEQNEKSVSKKVKKTLGGIIGGGFDPIYLISQRLVKHSNDEGYLVGSRGSVGSSFVATMMGITEVNPLPAHYRCLKCKHSIFEDEDGKALGADYSSGFDLPDKNCPVCGELMKKDGQDMPFATFLGFNADKVPDIDLNFSDLNQASAHEYTKVLFGVDNVYRAGTIGTVAEKTAYGFVRGYFEDKGIFDKRSCEIERLAMGCTGVKRTTGQHPGGIVVVPDYMEVADFTPFQFPADDVDSAWRTTHFDYHAIDADLLKLDILGHSDPTQLRLIQDLSGTDVLAVPLDDKDTMSIFTTTEKLGVTNEEIMCATGTLGIPEFGTPFTIGMVAETKPTTFAELVKISGLSHGTDVWLGNARDLCTPDESGNIRVPFKDVIGCRDDIMVYLMYHGVKPIKAFKIMEFVRKGKASKDAAGWAEHRATMEEAGIEEWFIDSCFKIKYMFPKAHAAAYVTSAFRIAWYKVHMPEYFYASWYSTKATDFDIDAMIKGYDAIKNRILEIKAKGYDATNKENGVLECLNVALEMAARKIKIQNFDLYKSKGMTFSIDEKTHELIPPFITIDGLGAVVAKNIEEEAAKKPFVSIEEFQSRCKVSQTLIDKMKVMGLFDGMPESSQLSLFDLGAF